MADPLSHALLGAACVPDRPFLGAAFGLLADFKEIPNNIYTLIRFRKFAVGENWDIGPAWLKKLGKIQHALYPVSFLFFGLYFFVPDIAPLFLAYMTHVIIDPLVHDQSEVLYPFSETIFIGRDWHSTWKIWAATIGGSGLVVFLQHI